VSPRAINAGRFRLRVGVDVGVVAAGFEQREMFRVLAGQECAAGEAAAIAGDPITLAVALDVEVIGSAHKFRDKMTLFPTGGMWQALSRGDREEARPITGVLAMALIRNLFVGGFVEI
jgi:hypothetical protein